jgi:uncharacterized protein YidB (DUF937 family)
MGLLDILGQIGGRPGAQNPFGGQAGGSGLSPIATALIALLAGKVLGGGPGGPFGGGPFGNAPPGGSGGLGDILGSVLGGGQPRGGMPSGGGLGDLLGGLLGGAGPGGGRGGSVLTGGLNDLLRQFEQSGHGNAAQSWIGRSENQHLSPEQIEQALGSEQVDSLAEQAGLSRVGLLEGLSQELPGFVDQLTPDGRIPTDEEAEQIL